MARPRGSRNRPTKNPSYKKGYLTRRRPVHRTRRIARGAFTVQRFAKPMATLCTGAGTVDISGANIELGTPVKSLSNIDHYYDVPFAMDFFLSDISSYKDITNICDKYKILKVQVQIRGCNSAMWSGGNATQMPYIQYWTDSDDIAVPTLNQIDEIMGLKTKGFDQTGLLKFSLTPKVSMLTYGGSGYNGYAVPARPEWIMSSFPSVPHYGVKGVIRNMYLNSTTYKDSFTFLQKYTIRAADLQ